MILSTDSDNVPPPASRQRRVVCAILAALVLVHGLKTYRRNEDWRDEYSIFTAGLRVNANNAKLYNNVGHALEGQRQFDRALKFFQQAVR